jgi:2',3'-cyclic-nucleotide 2'-phosphodiesterase/3'-nucleotidase
MHLTGFDYFADRASTTTGLTRTASLIGQARTQARECGALTLLFDNGDGLQGTPMEDAIHGVVGRVHPLMCAFEHLRYDAVGLGNHDFNFGLKALDATLRDAPCPVVSSNLHRIGSATPASHAPFAILDRIVTANGSDWPIRIGVLSFLPPQTLEWDAHILGNRVEIDDIVESAQAWLPELRQAGCDLIIALAHSGLDAGPAHAGMENAVIPLAGTGGIDAIVAGHTHLILPGPDHDGMPGVEAGIGSVMGKPVVMPGSAGSHLGVIDLSLCVSADGQWRPVAFACSARPIAAIHDDRLEAEAVAEDPDLKSLLAEDHRETCDRMGRPTGHATQSMHSYFTFFAPDRALGFVAAAQAAALRPVLAGTPLADLPVLSAASPLKFGGRAGPQNFTDIPAGPMSERHVADLHVFPNELRAVILTGAQVIAWLEASARLFHRIEPGSRAAELIDPEMPGHDFDVLHGLTYEFDLSAQAQGGGGRVRDVRYGGRPIGRDQRFVVALNSYRASRLGRIAALARAELVNMPPVSIRRAILDYLTQSTGPDPIHGFEPVWRFKALPGTFVHVRTGPSALGYLDELAGRGIEVVGLDASGFLELKIPL